MEIAREKKLEDALECQRAKQQLDRLNSFLSNISPVRFNGFIEEQDYRFDVGKAWGKAIRYDTDRSSSISVDESRENITKWMIQRISFIEDERYVLLSIPTFTLARLSALEFSSDRLLVESICNELRLTTNREIDFMLINSEQSRLVIFEETEHEILSFEWTATPDFQFSEKET